mmetsp:Transcript_44102/g.105027  ORF Transcript_44102/g.105027 Transcript_44102/m.105027 type:complete len:226 (+) Transcript_44102:847-1524(+)
MCHFLLPCSRGHLCGLVALHELHFDLLDLGFHALDLRLEGLLLALGGLKARLRLFHGDFDIGCLGGLFLALLVPHLESVEFRLLLRCGCADLLCLFVCLCHLSRRLDLELNSLFGLQDGDGEVLFEGRDRRPYLRDSRLLSREGLHHRLLVEDGESGNLLLVTCLADAGIHLVFEIVHHVVVRLQLLLDRGHLGHHLLALGNGKLRLGRLQLHLLREFAGLVLEG